MRHSKKFVGLLLPAAVLLIISGLTACGGDTVDGMPGGGDGAAPPPAAVPAPAPTTPEATSAEPTGPEVPTRGVTQLQWGEGARDPFTRPYPEQAVATTSQEALEDVPEERPEDMGPLAPYPIETLRLIGIISRSARPVAMFTVPGRANLAEFAYIGDRVGPNGAGYIYDIQPNQVIIAYEGDPSTPVERLPVQLRNLEGDFDAEFVLDER